ncbi:MAG: AAA family ATPase [Erysipelothrix sp.]
MEDINLNGLYDWYESNKNFLARKADKWKFKNKEITYDFLKEWPLERLSEMTIDEYVTGKGADNKSFCYEIEHGKYAEMYLGIRGGSAAKFGIYWNKDQNAYIDQNNNKIPDELLENKFSQLKKDLISIIEGGINFDFSNEIFNVKSDNTFYSRPAMITKLLCAYSTQGSYSGINMNKDQKEVWSKLVPVDKQGGVYKQNYEITSAIHDKYPELDGRLLSSILWEYRNEVLESDNTPIENDEVDPNIDYKNRYSSLLLNEKNVIFRGAPGTGKTYLANEVAADIVSQGRTKLLSELSEEEKERIGFVQFHPSYDYTDFVEGLRPVSNDEGHVAFELKSGTFKSFVEKAVKSQISEVDEKYVFIIDEINRGEISKIFGELFFSIDPGYRGNKEGVFTQYSNLHDKKEKFYIPENLYIIGTMNDIDRSVDTFDFAMRRRFAFCEITAEESAENMIHNSSVKELMYRLNEAIISKEIGGLTDDYKIGASYFLSIDGSEIDQHKVEFLWNTKLQPLLKDYFRGEHKSSEKLAKIKIIYFDEVLNNDSKASI